MPRIPHGLFGLLWLVNRTGANASAIPLSPPKTSIKGDIQLVIPNRASDLEVGLNNSRLLGGENFTHQKAVLELMHLYLKLFGKGEKSPGSLARRVYFGPKDYMKDLPENDPFFDFDDQYYKYQTLKRELISNPKKTNTAFHNSGKHNDFWREFFKCSAKKRPDLFEPLSEHSFRNNITGEVWDLNEHDPFLASALSMQEDLVLLQKNGESPVIDDLSVCFPSRWNPRGGPSLSIKQVHDIVPKFVPTGREAMIQTIMNKLEKPGVRFTRAVHPLPYLHQATDLNIITLPEGITYTPDNLKDELFLRLEKQRFCRGDNVTGGNKAFEDLLWFSIKTYIIPLRAIEACPDFANAMLRLHEGFLDEPVEPGKPHDIFLKYRGGTETFIHPLIEYLGNIAKNPSPENPFEKISLVRIPDRAYKMPPVIVS